jgi:hypothetical protein
MPNYVIERVWEPMDEELMAEMAVKSQRIIDDSFDDLTWEKSQIVVDSEGGIRTFCVYAAPDEARIREHSAILGCHRIDNIYELAGVIDPADFPT